MQQARALVVAGAKSDDQICYELEIQAVGQEGAPTIAQKP
ncbi:hypothetical protein J2X71_007425 [Rhizobium sp. 1399]|nr:hypothetical protein [Rhizobium sp. 1399]